jgi:hypothetical protein
MYNFDVCYDTMQPGRWVLNISEEHSACIVSVEFLNKETNFSEIFVHSYQNTRYHNQDDNTRSIYCRENLK